MYYENEIAKCVYGWSFVMVINWGGGGMIVQAIPPPHLKYWGDISPHPPGIDTHDANHGKRNTVKLYIQVFKY